MLNESNDENTLIIHDIYIANQYMQEFKKRPKNRSDIDSVSKAWLKHKLDNGILKSSIGKDMLVIAKNGKVSKSKYFPKHFWSDDMLIGNEEGHALKMEVRTYHGVDCLIVEKGRLGDGLNGDELNDIPTDYHCGFFVYVRAK